MWIAYETRNEEGEQTAFVICCCSSEEWSLAEYFERATARRGTSSVEILRYEGMIKGLSRGVTPPTPLGGV